ncbi:hypothetical protein AVEN_218669-1 [Araneus ventricosus]|uniref:Uncharacterized protein n=1 Tax=Araneus ventricosus TaxID=182803 RepID=A0A4Y2B6H8_ARAVE|nr:hypothetical protein AVEN_218669-1 [Araneus ventricosus]
MSGTATEEHARLQKLPVGLYCRKIKCSLSPGRGGNEVRWSKYLQRNDFGLHVCSLVPTERPLPHGEDIFNLEMLSDCESTLCLITLLQVCRAGAESL